MQTNYFLFLPLLILPVVIGIFVWLFIRKGKRHPRETGRSARFETSCAGIIGWVTYRGPFIRLSVYDDFLVVACSAPYLLEFSEIERVEAVRFGFVKGFRIHHHNLRYPERIEVWPRDRETLASILADKIR